MSIWLDSHIKEERSGAQYLRVLADSDTGPICIGRIAMLSATGFRPRLFAPIHEQWHARTEAHPAYALDAIKRRLGIHDAHHMRRWGDLDGCYSLKMQNREQLDYPKPSAPPRP